MDAHEGSTKVDERLPAEGVEADRMAGHWLLARMGKRVLRPGGVQLTHKLLDAVAITSSDDVVEFAPGLGATTELILERRPSSYRGVDRDPIAAERVAAIVAAVNGTVVRGTAADTGLDDHCADVAFGEAYLTMQPTSQKERIIAELRRILRPGGRMAIHEVSFGPDASSADRERMTKELRDSIKVHVSPLTGDEWASLLTGNGFKVTARETAPLHLLEPQRLVADEGLFGAVRFILRVLSDGEARSRVLAMRRAMSGNGDKLQAVMISAVKVD